MRAYDRILAARRQGDRRQVLISTHTRRNAKRIKRWLLALQVPEDFFLVCTRHEQLMLAENQTLVRNPNPNPDLNLNADPNPIPKP